MLTILCLDTIHFRAVANVTLSPKLNLTVLTIQSLQECIMQLFSIISNPSRKIIYFKFTNLFLKDIVENDCKALHRGQL